MPTTRPATTDSRRSHRWPVRWLAASLILCAGYGTYMLLAVLAHWPLPRGSSPVDVFVALLVGLCAASAAVLLVLRRESGSRPVAEELAHLAQELKTNRRQINELADRTVPIIYANTPPQTPAVNLDTHPKLSRDDYWRVYADVLVDLAGVGAGDDPQGGVHPSVHP